MTKYFNPLGAQKNKISSK